jgi:hypothetical protein
MMMLFAVVVMVAQSLAGQQIQREDFVSVLGRFGISMPSPYVEYRPFVEFRTSSGQKFSSANYRWLLDADQVVVSYGAGSVNLEDPVQSGAFLNALRDDYITKSAQGSLLGEKKTTLGGHPGIIFVVESSSGRVMAWVYVVKNRFYLISLSLNDPAKTEEHVNIVSTFRFMFRDELEGRYKKLVAQLTPEPLPEESPTKRPTSDAQDARLKGRVKSVFTEEERYEGTVLFDDPSRVAVEIYDEEGNLVKSELYSADLPQAVRLYGYMKGERVYKEMRKYPDLRLVSSDPKKKDNVTKGQAPAAKIFRIKYKYNADQLLEIRVNRDDGQVFEKYVFMPKEKKVEHTFDPGYMIFGAPMNFAKDKLISLLDDNGNALEDTLMTPSGKVDYDNRANFGITYQNYTRRYDAEKFKHKYEFDEGGNWIKRTTFAVITGKGEVPDHVTYRKITYYP